MSFQNIEENLEDLGNNLTPFLDKKTAIQQTTFTIDPSKGLTKKRYAWNSNDNRFDNSLISEVDKGGIELETNANNDDTVRIRSAVPGRYDCHTLAVPGVAFYVDPSNINRNNGIVSTNGGLIAIGAGWHDNSAGGWEVNGTNGTIRTFFGFKIDSNGTDAVLVSEGEHQADSPVPQEEWNIDTMDGSGDNDNPSGMEFRPDQGLVWNGPYIWYSQGALVMGFVDKTRNKFIKAHRFEVKSSPSLDRPNMPTTMIIDNDGAAKSTKAFLGGMQFSRYGTSSDDTDRRLTSVTRQTSGDYISDSVSIDSKNSVDPRANAGKPIISVKKERRLNDVNAIVKQISADVNEDIYIYIWDEYDAPNALTNQNFRKPTSADIGETKLSIDTEANAYTPQTALLRGLIKIKAGDQTASVGEGRDTAKIPIDATRVYTAVHDGTAADVTPFKVDVEESY